MSNKVYQMNMYHLKKLYNNEHVPSPEYQNILFFSKDLFKFILKSFLFANKNISNLLKMTSLH